MKRDGKYLRRVVPSPTPVRIEESESIERLLGEGHVVICCGGGGIPVLENGQGAEAVIDKDLAAALLAEQIDADGLVILTDADAVYEHWGTPCSDRSAKRRRKSWRLCPRRRRDGDRKSRR